jgi:predicted ester cyclase
MMNPSNPSPGPRGPSVTDEVQALVQTYYSVFDAASSDPRALDAVVAEGWQNRSSNGSVADKNAFIGLVSGIRQAVPNLRWQVDEVILAGDRVVVRGTGSGTPAAPLFGVPVTGRGFSIMSIDIHTVKNGRIASSFHLEDWAGAMGQLTGA